MKAPSRNKHPAQPGSRRHYQLMKGSGRHHAHSASPDSTLPSETSDELTEVTVSRRSRLLQAAVSAGILGLAAAIIVPIISKEYAHKAPTPPVASSAREYAQYGLDIFNQTGYGHLSHGGKDLTITLPTNTYGAGTLTITSDSAQRQPGSHGKLEPNPADVTSVAAQGQLEDGEISTSLIRDADGDWSVVYTAPNESGILQRSSTEIQDGNPITEITIAGSETQVIAGNQVAYQALRATGQISGAIAQTAVDPRSDWPTTTMVA